MINNEQEKLDAISNFLKNSTEEFTDFDWDGNELKVFLNDELIEKYSEEDLKEIGVF